MTAAGKGAQFSHRLTKVSLSVDEGVTLRAQHLAYRRNPSTQITLCHEADLLIRAGCKYGNNVQETLMIGHDDRALGKWPPKIVSHLEAQARQESCQPKDLGTPCIYPILQPPSCEIIADDLQHLCDQIPSNES